MNEKKCEYMDLIGNCDIRRALAHSKRFLERYLGDAEFRNAILSEQLSLMDAADECGCEIDIRTLLPVFHPSYVPLRATACQADWPLTYYWNQFIQSKLEIRRAVIGIGDSAGLTPVFDLWRQRNISRSRFEIGPPGRGIVHPPVSFELSSGCSVGCPFCGVSALPFRGYFALKDGGAAEWRRALLGVKNVLGRGLKMGFCYWATDPLDNPDYAGFLEIFSELMNYTPQTTTAIPLRDVELTRKVLAMWNPRQIIPNRFSVLTTGILKRIHKTFTPEELLGVELVLQNSGNAEITKVRAGKNIARVGKLQREGAKPEPSTNGTIACVSGFLINLVEKTIRLVSPTMPSTRWPDGYIVYAQSSYTAVEQLEGKLRGMIKENMSLEVSSSSVLSFVDGIEYASEENVGWLRSSAMEVGRAEWKRVCELIEQRCFTPIQMVEALCRDGDDPFTTVGSINALWRTGLVESV